MNPIREFFKKNRKFRNAGRGQVLGDRASSPNTSRTPPPITNVPTRQVPHSSAESKKAAEAAMARFEQNQNKKNVNWSLTAVRSQARKELELEKQAKDKECNAPKEVHQDSCPFLAVTGVFYACPLIGPYVLPYQEILVKIREFLYEQLEEERGLTACLIIHSCNRDKQKVKTGIETLSKYLTNIIEHPTEEKYQKIRIQNKTFQEKVACLEGTYDFLLSCGFVEKSLPSNDGEEEKYLVFSADLDVDVDNLQMMLEALSSAEPIHPTLDRCTKVLMPSQSAEQISLPSDFFNITKDELVKEQENRSHAVEMNSLLQTKAMRERGEVKELMMYKYSLVRIRFPDGLILQGTFSCREKLSAVKEFIAENLAHPDWEYELLAPGGFKLGEDSSSLLDLKLVPAVFLNLTWTQNIKLDDEIAYLKLETMSLLETM